MLNDNLAIVIVCQDAEGKFMVKHTSGDVISNYIYEIIGDVIDSGLDANAMFNLGYLAALDAIAGGSIDFTTPRFDITQAYREMLGGAGADRAVVTDVFSIVPDRIEEMKGDVHEDRT